MAGRCIVCLRPPLCCSVAACDFPDLTPAEVERFQENLLKTMMSMEDTYFELARTSDKNCLIICDRGTMDASAFVSKEIWEKIVKAHNWHTVDLRDNRYNQIVHLVSAANGAEEFYNTEDNSCRTEGHRAGTGARQAGSSGVDWSPLYGCHRQFHRLQYQSASADRVCLSPDRY
ncbi:hypothetical protein MRX96_059706 [Rhipicephalus microplus]